MGSAKELSQYVVPEHDSILLIDYESSTHSTYQDSCQELIKTIQHYSNEFSIHLVGYSMGGRFFSSIFPDIVSSISSLKFISCGLPLVDPKKRYQKFQFEQLVLKKIDQLNATDFCKWWYQLPLYAPLSGASFFENFILNRAATFDKNHIKWLLLNYSALRMPFNQQTSIKRTTKIEFLYGEYDKKYSSIAIDYAKWIPSIIIKKIPNTGHLCWYSPSQ